MGGIDFLYLAANAAVTMRQASLLKRTNDIRRRKNRRARNATALSKATPEELTHIEPTQPQLPESEETVKKVKRTPRGRAVMAAAAITLTGQAIFSASYAEGWVEENNIKCRQQATEIVQEYEQVNGNVLSS